MGHLDAQSIAMYMGGVDDLSLHVKIGPAIISPHSLLSPHHLPVHGTVGTFKRVQLILLLSPPELMRGRVRSARKKL